MLHFSQNISKDRHAVTCIVAIKEKDTIWMGADDRVTEEEYYTSKYDTILKTKTMLIGFAGDLNAIQLARYGFDPKLQTDKQTDLEYLVTVYTKKLKKRLGEFGLIKIKDEGESAPISMLIAYRGNLYNITEDFAVLKLEQTFYATGDGHALALGSLFTTEKLGNMHPKERIRMALKVAASYITTVGNRCKIKTIKF